MNAIFSPDRRFRYVLYRTVQLDVGRPQGRRLNFIGLNPSTADETHDDPTIRRCIGFARDWGFSGLVITNIYGFRSTDPARLQETADPVGPENDRHLLREANYADLVVAAWSGYSPARSAAVRLLLGPMSLWCLGLTKDGSPRHPLYIRATQKPARLN